MGGEQADLLFVEWSDRDAGSGPRPWWDDADHLRSPPYAAPSYGLIPFRGRGHKRLLLWQMPVGNMPWITPPTIIRITGLPMPSPLPRDLADAGIVGMLFGGGADCLTQVERWRLCRRPGSDCIQRACGAGWIDSRQPDRLPRVPLRWQENSEPDLWKYRLLYRRLPDGMDYQREVGRRNAEMLPLLQAGVWEIRLIAIDAMGNESPPSAPVNTTIPAAAWLVHLPILNC